MDDRDQSDFRRTLRMRTFWPIFSTLLPMPWSCRGNGAGGGQAHRDRLGVRTFEPNVDVKREVIAPNHDTALRIEHQGEVFAGLADGDGDLLQGEPRSRKIHRDGRV